MQSIPFYRWFIYFIVKLNYIFMNSSELRKLQTPLKEKYKTDPSSADIILKAQGNLEEDISCLVETRNGQIKAGLHPATGGDGSMICSGDMLLEALVACAGVTLMAVATAIGIEVRNGKVNAEGYLDFRGTLGVSKDVPVGFKSIRLNFYFDSSASHEQIENLFKLTERYCVVYQTLSKSVPIETSYNKK